MADIDRRGVLQVGIGALALASHAHAQTASPPSGNGDGGHALRFFNAEEAAVVSALVDRLIPHEAEHPGAVDAGVVQYIDLQLDGPYGRGERLYLGGPIKPGTPQQGYQLGLAPAELYRRFLAAIDGDLRTRRLEFARADDAVKDDYLRRLERGDVVAEGVSSAVFFETLLANTIEGYFSDPAYGGNRDMAGWRMIGFPGAYAAYLGIYTQHGIRFERPPLAMTSGGGHHHKHP